MKMLAADLEQVLANLGMALGKSTNTEVWALCPGHDDSNPTSFSVNRDTGAAFCFACSYRRADLHGLAMDVLGLDAWAAAVWLRENGASLSARIERVRDRNPSVRRGPKTESGYSLEGEFAVFGDVPKSELKEKRLSREAVDFYEIRWDNGDFIIPIKDTRGNLKGWQRRRKPRPLNYPRELKKSQYVFGAYEFVRGRAIVVESPLDVVRLRTAGYTGAVSSFGAYVSYAQKKIIEGLASRVLVAMDNPYIDEAGDKATRELIEFFAPRCPTHALSYADTDAKDPGEMTDSEIDQAVSKAVYAARMPRESRRVKRREKV